MHVVLVVLEFAIFTTEIDVTLPNVTFQRFPPLPDPTLKWLLQLKSTAYNFELSFRLTM